MTDSDPLALLQEQQLADLQELLRLRATEGAAAAHAAEASDLAGRFKGERDDLSLALRELLTIVSARHFSPVELMDGQRLHCSACNRPAPCAAQRAQDLLERITK